MTDLKEQADMSDRTCSIEGCGKPHRARGWCASHYYAWKRNGDPLTFKRSPTPLGLTLEERFWMKVDKNGPIPPYAPHLGPCWPWTGCLTIRNYGYFGVSKGVNRSAHLVSYELLVGQIPVGLELDHLCHTLSAGTCMLGDVCPHRKCCNPAHLEPVTPAENMRRTMDARPSCSKGHLLDEENTRWYRGHRQCRTCDRDLARVRRESPVPGTRHVHLTVKLSAADAVVIDGARGDLHRSSWMRDAALAAATAEVAVPTNLPPVGDMRTRVSVLVLTTKDEAALIDGARSGMARSAWMRAAALAAAT